MDYRKTPPLQWLPVFEAAARHLSFKAAAAELHVTPPAVSQQINALEQWLAIKLFERTTRKLSLSPEGEYYYSVAQQVLQTHKQGFMELQRRFTHKALTISTPLFLAQEVLIPNYLSFSDYAPEVELRIETRTSMVDFDNENVDAAIRFGAGDWPELSSRKLGHCYHAIVANKTYLEENGPISRDDLSQHRLLSLYTELDDWQATATKGIKPNQPRIICDSYMSVLKSASEGLGLAIGIFPLTGLWVKQSKLVVVEAAMTDAGTAYWLVSPQHKQDLPAIEGLYLWAKTLFEKIERSS